MDGQGELLVEVRRGSYLESIHRVAGCIVNVDGEVLRSFGDVNRPYPVRSLAKPFIAVELVRSGACEAFGIGDVEIALASGSHDGQPDHVAAVRTFLAKIGSSESDLRCGPALEGKIAVGSAAVNNCSGKHAAILAMCRHLSLSTEDYVAPGHPIQQRLLQGLFQTFGCTQRETPLAVDGCGLPIFGACLRDVARAYARFGTAKDDAVKRVLGAMTAEPAFVGGWLGNLDTQIISWSRGAIVGKIGAEGLHADALTANGLGVAVKVLDGNSRALPAALASIFGNFDSGSIDSQHFEEFRSRAIFNASGRQSGAIQMPAEPLHT
jgi:L-asparaginase II